MLFSKEEIRRNLLGGLEIALFMQKGSKRFGNTYDEAMRSFIIPILLFPFSLAALYLFPIPEMAGASKNALTLMFSLRLSFSWLAFFGIIYWMLQRLDHMEHFYRFVIATNWLTVPATVVFIPVAFMLLGGNFSWIQLYPFMKFLVIYSYAFSAFMAVHVLIVPWELAGFFVFLTMMIDKSTLDFMHWVGTLFSS
ncbi:MAG: hypothetical protein JWO78_449 [Micavibrio sp.]|nr:hypothetical protein [Micavibrio sp.]